MADELKLLKMAPRRRERYYRSFQLEAVMLAELVTDTRSTISIINWTAVLIGAFKTVDSKP